VTTDDGWEFIVKNIDDVIKKKGLKWQKI
jgi:hypothetical protein